MATGALKGVERQKPSRSIVVTKAKFGFNDIKAAEKEYAKRQDFLKTKISNEFIQTADDFGFLSSRGSTRDQKVRLVLSLDSYDLKIYNGDASAASESTQAKGKHDDLVHQGEEAPGHVGSPVKNWKLHYNEKEVSNYKAFRSDKQRTQKHLHRSFDRSHMYKTSAFFGSRHRRLKSPGFGPMQTGTFSPRGFELQTLFNGRHYEPVYQNKREFIQASPRLLSSHKAARPKHRFPI